MSYCQKVVFGVITRLPSHVNGFRNFEVFDHSASYRSCHCVCVSCFFFFFCFFRKKYFTINFLCVIAVYSIDLIFSWACFGAKLIPFEVKTVNWPGVFKTIYLFFFCTLQQFNKLKSCVWFALNACELNSCSKVSTLSVIERYWRRSELHNTNFRSGSLRSEICSTVVRERRYIFF